MKISFPKSVFFCILLSFSFSLTLAAQTQQFKTNLPVKEDSKNIKAKRAIIKLLLTDFFKNKGGKEIVLSTKNIPAEIQKEFPAIENLTTRLIAHDAISQENSCPFEFRTFTVSGKKASVLFGDCNDGLGYTFEKSRSKWKLISNQIAKPN